MEQPAETLVWPSKVGVVAFSSQRVISFSTDAELNCACVRAHVLLVDRILVSNEAEIVTVAQVPVSDYKRSFKRQRGG